MISQKNCKEKNVMTSIHAFILRIIASQPKYFFRPKIASFDKQINWECCNSNDHLICVSLALSEKIFYLYLFLDIYWGLLQVWGSSSGKSRKNHQCYHLSICMWFVPHLQLLSLQRTRTSMPTSLLI